MELYYVYILLRTIQHNFQSINTHMYIFNMVLLMNRQILNKIKDKNKTKIINLFFKNFPKIPLQSKNTAFVFISIFRRNKILIMKLIKFITI